jgi:D-serine deaminase-like pyridoxal phosphate-dependent protein
LRAINAKGIRCPIVTGAGTGTWTLERDSGVWNELQPGSYVFMDADYARNTAGAADVRFEQSLFVIATVMSTNATDRVICDAGLKAFSFDSGPPVVHDREGVRYVKASDEHGVLEVERAARAPVLGERVWLIPGHCDPTVNLYDWIVGIRDGRVVCVWSVAARGALG